MLGGGIWGGSIGEPAGTKSEHKSRGEDGSRSEQQGVSGGSHGSEAFWE
jgi:hypothetical protein